MNWTRVDDKGDPIINLSVLPRSSVGKSSDLEASVVELIDEVKCHHIAYNGHFLPFLIQRVGQLLVQWNS